MFTHSLPVKYLKSHRCITVYAMCRAADWARSLTSKHEALPPCFILQPCNHQRQGKTTFKPLSSSTQSPSLCMHTYRLYIGFHSSCCQRPICRRVLGLPEHLPGHEMKHGWQLIQECVDTLRLGCFTMLKVLDLRHQWLPSPTPWEEPRCRLKLCEKTMQGIGQLRYLEELVSYLSVPKLICMALGGFQRP